MREAAIRLPLKKKETTNFSPLSVHTNEIRSNFRFLFNLHLHKVTRLFRMFIFSRVFYRIRISPLYLFLLFENKL